MDSKLDGQLDRFSQQLAEMKAKIDQSPRDLQALQGPLEGLLLETLNLKSRIEMLYRDIHVQRRVGTYTIYSTPPEDGED